MSKVKLLFIGYRTKLVAGVKPPDFAAPSNYKDQAKIAAYIADRQEEFDRGRCHLHALRDLGQEFVLLGPALELPRAEAEQDGEADEGRDGETGERAKEHYSQRPSSGRKRYCSATISALKTGSRPRHSAMVSGPQIRACTQMGGA